MRAYLEMLRGGFMVSIAYRWHVFLRLVGTVMYLIMSWFLWKAVYAGQSTLHGLSFEATFMHISCAAALFPLFKMFQEWFMSHDIISGNIVSHLVRPIDYQLSALARDCGFALMNLFAVVIPSMVLLFCFFGSSAIDSPVRALLFVLSIGGAFIIAYLMDFFVGTFSFYTESIWGFSMAKDAIVTFFSGALIPVVFFPGPLRAVIEWLPFRAIYNTPLEILLHPEIDLAGCFSGLGLQLFWCVALFGVSRFFFSRALRTVTVNGG